MMKTRTISAILAVIIALGLVLIGGPASASSRRSERRWRYLTYGAAGLTAYGAIAHRPTLALLGAAGTAYSYSRWRKDVRNRHRHARVRYVRGRHYRHYRHYRHRYYRHR